MNPAEGKMTDDDHLFDDAPQGVAPCIAGRRAAAALAIAVTAASADDARRRAR